MSQLRTLSSSAFLPGFSVVLLLVGALLPLARFLRLLDDGAEGESVLLPGVVAVVMSGLIVVFSFSSDTPEGPTEHVR